MCRVGHLDPSRHRAVLMKTGLILLIVGHLIFISGALVRGSGLRLVLGARDAAARHYGVTNSATAIAALLAISCGVCALLLSRYLGPAALKWALLALSCCSSLCCLLALLVAVALALGTQGRLLLGPCSAGSSTPAPGNRECPFEPTRAYSSTLSLWVISLLLEATGIFFSTRCLLLTLELLSLGCRCCRGMLRMEVSLQEAPVESPSPGQCLALLRLDSGESARL
ncbi:transmembrane protein 54 [Melospiza melodia melodia]|uniref:transmembrane protein 54 n=1 Tax=Melospiza melodia melodia TaxID=1914991 RepID=UPI002FD6C731